MRDNYGNEQPSESVNVDGDGLLSPSGEERAEHRGQFGDESERPVREVYGSSRNIERHGSPIEQSKEQSIRYFFYPTWRSQLMNLIGFFALSGLCIMLSRWFPITILTGKLFAFRGTMFVLHFPTLIFMPGILLGRILVKVYDAKYVIDEGGVEAQIGLVSMNLRQPRLRWEDIRGSEPQQTLWERMLGIGTVGIGSAMTQDVEIVMTGVANPRAIQLLIQGERDRRLQDLRAAGRNSGRVAAVLDD
ncbi:MAG: PH domain-containing protein [Bdellovibrionota bacterium]